MVVSSLTMPCDLDAKVNKSDTKGELTFPRMRKRFPKKRKQKKRGITLALCSQVVGFPDFVWLRM